MTQRGAGKDAEPAIDTARRAQNTWQARLLADHLRKMWCTRFFGIWRHLRGTCGTRISAGLRGARVEHMSSALLFDTRGPRVCLIWRGGVKRVARVDSQGVARQSWDARIFVPENLFAPV